MFPPQNNNYEAENNSTDFRRTAPAQASDQRLSQRSHGRSQVRYF